MKPETLHTLIFASNNQHKVLEVRSALGEKFKIVTLPEAGINIDIAEPFDTIEENAVEKASVIYDLTNTDCFADDTALEVDALNGEPGVRSARYADAGNANLQTNSSGENNIAKLFKALEGIENREAAFRTVICLILNGEKHMFEGICKGIIIAEKRGQYGFGYDPVFMPLKSNKTLAEMDMDEKNQFSHRKKAVDKLVVFLQKEI
ncbi:MAG: RdgB/HAM1 family non-canonical purine NTP pyrophosphatase [Chitinophagaceae bacterium]|nr:RdgB/HAM1 family non-canonical purine NTP pyrophosphatase [Chitinophagaceae bacterium]